MKAFFSAATAATFVATVAAQANYTIQCYDGLAVLVNRASTEPLGFGVMATLKDQILAAVPNSGAWYNPYPATIDNYGTSEPAGVGNLTQVYKAYVDKCPCHKVALLGFSQGAQVISDTLIGPSYSAFSGFGVNSGIGQPYLNALSSAVLFADPAQVANLSINAGNSTQSDGFFVRNNTQNWANFGLVGRVRAFCQDGDYYCAKGTGPNAGAIHRSATLTFGAQGVQFIIQTWNNSTKNTCSSSTSTNGTSSTNSTSATNSTGATGTTTARPSTSTSARPFASTTAGNSGVKAGISSGLLLAALALAL